MFKGTIQAKGQLAPETQAAWHRWRNFWGERWSTWTGTWPWRKPVTWNQGKYQPVNRFLLLMQPPTIPHQFLLSRNQHRCLYTKVTRGMPSTMRLGSVSLMLPLMGRVWYQWSSCACDQVGRKYQIITMQSERIWAAPCFISGRWKFCWSWLVASDLHPEVWSSRMCCQGTWLCGWFWGNWGYCYYKPEPSLPSRFSHSHFFRRCQKGWSVVWSTVYCGDWNQLLLCHFAWWNHCLSGIFRNHAVWKSDGASSEHRMWSYKPMPFETILKELTENQTRLLSDSLSISWPQTLKAISA